MQSKSAIRFLIAAVALVFGAADVLAGPVAARSALDRDIELELLLIRPPVPDGSRLGPVLASQPHNLSLLGTGNHAKSSPATAPAAYADLMFTAVTPCRILDSRLSQGGTGPWPAGSTNSIKIGPYPAAGGGYAAGLGAQGGSASGCGLDALAGPGKIAVVMVAVSTVAQAGAGYLTFFSSGAPNPGATSVSQWYQPGYVQTSFVLIPTDLIGAVWASGFSSATTEVIIDVAGYFAAPGNINLANSTATTGNILKGGFRFIHNFGTFNTFIGVNAGNFLMSGGYNTANGANALQSNTTGSANTASGVDALFSNTTGNQNTASGYQVLFSNTTGSDNTASGNQALFDNTTGSDNTASGNVALALNTTGNQNTASGASALQRNTTGDQNTASGYFALFGNTTGGANTASGHSALSSNTTGVQNTANGINALLSNTTANSNTASGARALETNSIGFSNTASGQGALFSNTTGSNNIGLGTGAGSFLTTGDNNIDIGNQGVAAETNTIRIGTSGTQTATFIAGISGATSAGGVGVFVNGSGQLGTITSSRRFKDDIADMDAASSALMKLRPVTFHYKADQNTSARTLQYGLVAEEVAEVYPGLIAHSRDGQVETVMYQFLPPMLLNEYQKQQRRIEMQTSHIAKLNQDRDMQMSRIVELEREGHARTAQIDALKSAAAEIAAQRQVIAELQAKTSEIDSLKSAMTDMGKMVDQLRRTNSVTASLPSR